MPATSSTTSSLRTLDAVARPTRAGQRVAGHAAPDTVTGGRIGLLLWSGVARHASSTSTRELFDEDLSTAGRRVWRRSARALARGCPPRSATASTAPRTSAPRRCNATASSSARPACSTPSKPPPTSSASGSAAGADGTPRPPEDLDDLLAGARQHRRGTRGARGSARRRRHRRARARTSTERLHALRARCRRRSAGCRTCTASARALDAAGLSRLVDDLADAGTPMSRALSTRSSSA